MTAAYAPSIYAFRSETEWENAMAEWLAENEPRTRISVYIWLDGKEVRVDDCEDEAHARRLLNAYPIPDEVQAAWEAQHPEGDLARWNGDHRPGGSRSDYLACGISRY